MAIYNFNRNETYASDLTDNRPDADQLNPNYAQYNPDIQDIALAEKLALESIRIAGIWVTVLPRTDDNKYDPVWNEDASPTYYTGYDFKAYLKPAPPEVVLTKFGHDSPVPLELTFSRAEVYKELGDRLIRIGDMIIVPYNTLVVPARKFRVTHVTESGNFRYRWIYLNVAVESWNKDESSAPLIT